MSCAPSSAQGDTLLRLLLLEPSCECAERLANLLRDGGYALRITRANDADELAACLTDHSFDLLMTTLEDGPLALTEVATALQASGQDMPLLAFGRAEPEAREHALADGAADLVELDRATHFHLVIRRELLRLAERRHLRQLERTLRESEARCQALLDGSRDPIAYVHDGMHVYANRAYLECFGIADSETIESLPLLDMVDGADRPRVKEFLRNFQYGQATANELELTMAAPGQSAARHRMCVSHAKIDGEPCTQILLRDAQPQAHRPEATPAISSDLGDRSDFLEGLEHALGEGVGSGRAVLFIHLDRLDDWQRSFEGSAVEAALSSIADAVADAVGSGGTTARYGHGAMTVLAPPGDLHEGIALAETIRRQISQLNTEHAGSSLTTTCSIGISLLSDDGSGRQALLNAQDAAAQALAAGGNQIQLFTANGSDEHSPDLHLKLSAALEGDDFTLVYQPIASLRGTCGQRYEARLRLRSGAGILPPKEFIGEAERCGLLPAMDRWVTREALRVLKRRLEQEPDTLLFIKLSAETLADHAGFAALLKQELSAKAVGGQHLAFQVDEADARGQLDAAKQLFRALKSCHCQFALDHFGASQNPFELLKHLPADYLKLHHELTSDLAQRQDRQAAVARLIEAAHACNRQVIAGYLEDVGSLALLWQQEADFVQGYFLQAPEPTMTYDFSGAVV